MSATLIRFPKEPVGPIFERSPTELRRQNRATHDAHLIRTAKRENDDWTARLLLALLETLDSKTLDILEFRLIGPDPDRIQSESIEQALAIVQLAKGDKGHRQRVSAALGETLQ